MADTKEKLYVGPLFATATIGLSWLAGTAIGWGLLHDVLLTFFAIGVIPLYSAAAIWAIRGGDL